MSVIFEAENYRGLKKVRWAPSGVCALVGPNGSGKTTLLRLPELFRYAVQRGFNEAVGIVGGFWGLKHLDAGSGEPLVLSATLRSLRYQIRVATVSTVGIAGFEESVFEHETQILHRQYGERRYEFRGAMHELNGEFSALRDAALRTGEQGMVVMNATLQECHAYSEYKLSQLFQYGSRIGAATQLDPSGENVFSVLQNWSGSFEDKMKYRFVVTAMKAAFPGVFDDLGFVPQGQSVGANFLPVGGTQGIPFSNGPRGLLVGLLHLVAVAGAGRWERIMIDEFENSLHPHAIRSLLQSIRDWLDEDELDTRCVAISTHSPVVMDEFNDEKENLFVMQPGREVQPVAVTDLADREWLDQFALGRLYTGGDIGSPNRAITKPEPTAA